MYRQGDLVEGQAIISTRGGQSHGGIKLTVEGGVSLQLSANTVGLFEAFSSSVKPVSLLSVGKDLQGPGKLLDGQTLVPFSFTLQPSSNRCDSDDRLQSMPLFFVLNSVF